MRRARPSPVVGASGAGVESGCEREAHESWADRNYPGHQLTEVAEGHGRTRKPCSDDTRPERVGPPPKSQGLARSRRRCEIVFRVKTSSDRCRQHQRSSNASTRPPFEGRPGSEPWWSANPQPSVPGTSVADSALTCSGSRGTSQGLYPDRQELGIRPVHRRLSFGRTYEWIRRRVRRQGARRRIGSEGRFGVGVVSRRDLQER
jgi:hypothetical protein